MNIEKNINNSKLVYLVRQEPEWDSYIPTIKNWNIEIIIKTWNKIFNIDYINFRKKLSNLRLEFIPKNFDIYTTTHNKIFHDTIKSENSIIVPTDDDDWMVPDMAEIIRSNFKKNYDFLRWNYAEYRLGEVMLKIHPYTEVPPKGEKFKLNYDFLTNNYCIKSPINPDLVHHTVANDFFDKNKNYINETFSMCNRSIASLSLINRWTKNSFYSEEKEDFFEIYNKKCEAISKENFEKILPKQLIKLYEISTNQHVSFRDCDRETPVFFNNMIDRMIEIYKKLKIKKI